MKRHLSVRSGFAAAALLAAVLAPAFAEAQRAVPRTQTSGDSSGGTTATSTGGGSSSDSGSSTSSRSKDSGSSSTVQRRPPSSDGAKSSGGTVARTPSGSSGESSGSNTPQSADGGRGAGDTPRSVRPTEVPSYSKPRDGNVATGRAVDRKGPPPPTDWDDDWDHGDYYGGYYPWGYGGFGFGGYYGGYYDPWYYGYPAYSSGYDYDGQLRLKMKPRDAEVFVDGYYAGVVDEFDGFWQHLHIAPGPHRIEVRAPGYEPLMFEVMMQPDRTVTYSGDLRRLP